MRLFIVAGLIGTLAGCGGAPPRGLAAIEAVGERGMVATVSPIATDVGVSVLWNGGNAIDAAVAAGLALGVVDPHNSGIGGGAFIVIRKSSGEVVVIDARETAPAKATRDMYVREGKVRPELAQTGPLAAGVPGALAGYELALQRAGTRAIAELIGPSAEMCERGFSASAGYSKVERRTAKELAAFPASRAELLKEDGTAHQAGDLVKRPGLGRTYRAIQRDGVDWFYRGEFARRLEEAMRADGGIITATDLAAYRAVEREAVVTTYRGHTVIGMPPPSSGGVHVAQILNVLEHFDARGLEDADRAHVLVEAMKLAFADRAHWLGDPDFVRVPKGLIDKAYAKQLSARIDLKRAGKVEGHGSPPGDDVFEGKKNRDDAKRLRGGFDAVGAGAEVADDWEKHTTHIAAADAAGNVVAITQTINTAYGSKWVVPGTGVVMNNEMDDFSIAPGTPNAFGLVGAEANAVAPGKRPLSSMSPTIVLKDGRPVMTVGAAGGPRIITAVVQAVVNRVDLGMGVGAALAGPRVHQQWRPRVVYVEKGVGVVEELKRRGHEVEVSGGLGVAQGIVWEGGKLVGAHDPRAGGKAAGR